MNVLQVNYSDLKGRIYNGYDLQISLNERGIPASQVVGDKLSDNEHVYCVNKNRVLHEKMKYMEKKFSISSLLYPYGLQVKEMECYKNADIVHYHLLYNHFISLMDIPMLMNHKKSVWTIHDPWIVTGNCIHPLECERWKTGCGDCPHLDNMGYKYLEMHEDNTREMWELKKQLLREINPTIVVASDFTKYYLEHSPLTKHFTNIVKIPFGVRQKENSIKIKNDIRKKFSFSEESFVIGFRNEITEIKGCNFLYKALENLQEKEQVCLLTTGVAELPETIKAKYKVVELGWVNDEKRMEEFFLSCDVFVMPSLAETFGLMAIEALSFGVPVVCFKDTVVEEIIQAPACGIAVEYKNVSKLKQALEYLVKNREVAVNRGMAGKKLVSEQYSYDQYVTRHIQLYESMNKNC